MRVCTQQRKKELLLQSEAALTQNENDTQKTNFASFQMNYQYFDTCYTQKSHPLKSKTIKFGS